MKFIYKIKSSRLFERVNYYLIVSLIFVCSFVVPSFGSRNGLNFLVYIVFATTALFVATYSLFFRKLTFNKYLIILPLFVAYSFIGTLFFSQQFRGWLTLFFLCVSYFMFYYAFRIINNNKIILSAIALGVFAFSLYFIIHYRFEIINYSSYGSESFRLGDYFDNQNDVALHCLVGFSLSVYLILFTKKMYKFLYLLPVASIFLVGLTTGSRTFILTSILIVILFLYFKMRNHKLIYLISLVLIIGLFVLLINLPFMSTIKERLLKMINTFFESSNIVDTSAISRSIWLDYGVFLGSRHILFGLGYGGFSIYSGVGTFTHSNAVEVFCDFGLIGAVLFYLPYFLLTYKTIKKNRNSLQLVLPLFILCLSISFSMVFFYNKMYYLLIALLSFVSINDSQNNVNSIKNKNGILFQ